MLAELRAGAEPPLLDSLNSFFVETRTQPALNLNIVRFAVKIDLDIQDDSSFDVGPLRFRRVQWCALRNYRWTFGEEVGLRMERQTDQNEA